jgi:hypothetical protein
MENILQQGPSAKKISRKQRRWAVGVNGSRRGERSHVYLISTRHKIKINNNYKNKKITRQKIGPNDRSMNNKSTSLCNITQKGIFS